METKVAKKVTGALPTAYYFTNFITEDEEEMLLREVYAAPIPKWQTLAHRRLQMWGGTPTPKGMVAEPLPSWILPYFDKLVKLTAFDESHRPNHILINEYCPGQGIMPHTDGPLYHPVITTISLGCQTLLDLYRPISRDDSGIAIEDDTSYSNRYLFSMLLERRSLFVVTEDLYTDYLHGIADRDEDKFELGKIANFNLLSDEMKKHLLHEPSTPTICMPRESTRVSLTMRHVPRTIKLSSKIFNIVNSWK